jgi:hypothetical protein
MAEFFTHDRQLRRGFDPNAHAATGHAHHRNRDIVADPDSFAHLSTKHQHASSFQSGIRKTSPKSRSRRTLIFDMLAQAASSNRGATRSSENRFCGDSCGPRSVVSVLFDRETLRLKGCEEFLNRFLRWSHDGWRVAEMVPGEEVDAQRIFAIVKVDLSR